jgi:hypothetical protein
MSCSYYLAAMQQAACEFALLPQVWVTLSVFALPAPTEDIFVAQEGQRWTGTVFMDARRMPLGFVSATVANPSLHRGQDIADSREEALRG